MAANGTGRAVARTVAGSATAGAGRFRARRSQFVTPQPAFVRAQPLPLPLPPLLPAPAMPGPVGAQGATATATPPTTHATTRVALMAPRTRLVPMRALEAFQRAQAARPVVTPYFQLRLDPWPPGTHPTGPPTRRTAPPTRPPTDRTWATCVRGPEQM
jgi:hypothetical protein